MLKNLFVDVEVVEPGPADPGAVVLDHHGRHRGHQTTGAAERYGVQICQNQKEMSILTCGDNVINRNVHFMI